MPVFAAGALGSLSDATERDRSQRGISIVWRSSQSKSQFSLPGDNRHSCAPRATDRLDPMPPITGRIEINLTVRDPVRSAAWYRELLGLQQRYDYTSDDGELRYVVLGDPAN